MKPFIIYYSRTGTTEKVADELSLLLKCESERIHDTKSRKGAFGWLRSGKEGSKKIIPKIKPIETDLKKYDTIIIGSPVWAGKISAPMRAFLDKHKPKNIIFFLTGLNKDNQPAIDDICKDYKLKPKNTITFTTKEVRKGLHKDRLEEFAKAIRQDTKQKKDSKQKNKPVKKSKKKTKR